MSAIIRVKRRNSAEPQDALLVACKRQKISENESDDSVTAVVKFAGTVKSQNEKDCIEHVTKNFNKEELQQNFKKHNVDISAKLRQEMKQKSRENRYKIINYHRSLGEKEDTGQDDVTTLIDIEDSRITNKNAKDEDNYVYDLYYMKTEQNLQIDSVHCVESELVFDNKESDDEEDDLYKTDDENSENNWRNDYPDESDNESVEDEDMRCMVENLQIGDDLSSDDEDFAYGLNEEDVNNYGYRYAKYKAKIKKEFCESGSDNSNDDEDSDSDKTSEKSDDYDDDNEENDDYY